MTERPILFSAPMVRALLDGRKTQTRRAIKPQPDWDRPEPCCSTTSEGWQGPIDRATWAESADPEMDFRRCPYGGPGDALWVRECFSYETLDVDGNGFLPPWYWADGNPTSGDFTRPKPSIHMPRWASRLTLQVADVRVERLNDISEADAVAEGLYRSKPTDEDREWFQEWTVDRTGVEPAREEWRQFDEGVWMVPGVPQGWGLTKAERRRDQWAPTPQFAYRQLWEHINGPGTWAANPWVWAVSFEVLNP
jgi:hypothetical protein